MKLLQLAGCDIVIPKTQSCCGALHGHAGEKSGAKELAKRNIKAFEDLNIDYIITNAGGCGAYLVDYDYLLKDAIRIGLNVLSSLFLKLKILLLY